MAEKKAAPKGASKAKSASPKTTETTEVQASGASNARGKGTKRAARKERLAREHAPAKKDNPFSKAMPPHTFNPGPQDIHRKWFVVDATDLVLGRAASRIAYVLRGKHKPTYTPHVDVGDYVVIINAEKIKLTGNKELQKPYYRHSMYPGGLKTVQARDVRVRDPERLLQDAIRRMISRNPLGRDMMGKLHVYKGPTHPHQAQKPEPLTLP